jgi:hypothetical protein
MSTLNKSYIEVNINNISEQVLKKQLCLVGSWLQQNMF